ncbi:MAG: enoyl-CoA hydratase-related protein [Steroidobacteraceae bacterium]
MADFCTVTREDHILIVTMNRPDKLNSMPPDSHAEMEKIWDAFVADPELRVGILTGAGTKAFCAGSDLSGYQRGYDGTLPRSGGGGLTHRLDCRKPIIAAVNGLAFGGGFEVMLACDFVIASEKAEFSLPEVLVGAGAFGGGIPRLCRKMPHAIALELVLTGRRMSVAEAQRFGLLNQVVAPEKVLDAAKEFARTLLRGAPLALESSKEVADMALQGFTLEHILKTEDGEPKQRVMRSADIQEGINAFFEKRAPRWQGR